MKIKPVRTEQDYEEVLRAVSPLFDNEPEPGSPEGDFFEIMCLLIEEYEKNTTPLILRSLLKLSNFGWIKWD